MSHLTLYEKVVLRNKLAITTKVNKDEQDLIKEQAKEAMVNASEKEKDETDKML